MTEKEDERYDSEYYDKYTPRQLLIRMRECQKYIQDYSRYVNHEAKVFNAVMDKFCRKTAPNDDWKWFNELLNPKKVKNV